MASVDAASDDAHGVTADVRTDVDADDRGIATFVRAWHECGRDPWPEPRPTPLSVGELMMELLSMMRMGALLAARDGRLVTANQAGRDVFEASLGLALRDGYVAADAPDARRKLRLALQQACRPPFVDGAVLFASTRGKPRICPVRVVALERVAARRSRSAGGLALLCIGGPRSRGPDAATLAQLFGLTATEAALMAGIAGGERLRQCAARRDVSLATVRAQLRNVFLKTGASTQAELTSIAWAVPGLWLD